MEMLGGDIYVSCSVVLPAFYHLLHVTEECEDDPIYVVQILNGISEGSWNAKADYKYRVAEEGSCMWYSIKNMYSDEDAEDIDIPSI